MNQSSNQQSTKKSTMRNANIAIALVFLIFATTRIVRILGLRVVSNENGVKVKLHPHFHGSENTSPLDTKN